MHPSFDKAVLALAISLSLAVPSLLPLTANAAEPQATAAGAEQSVTTPGGRATFLLPRSWASAPRSCQ